MRGFQAESTWSVAQMLPGALQGLRADLQFHHLALHNMDMPMLLSIGAQTLAVAGAVFLAIVGSRARRPLSLLLPVTMLWLLLILPILSPQYFLWLLPLLFVWLTEPSASGKASTRRVVAIFLLTTFIGLATRWVYPMHYGEFINEQSLSLIIVLNARTLAMLALFLLMIEPMVPATFRRRLRTFLPSLTPRQKHIFLIVQLSAASIILFFAGNFVHLREIFCCLSHRICSVHFFHFRIYEPPAQRGIIYFLLSRKSKFGFRHHKRRACHIFNTSCNI